MPGADVTNYWRRYQQWSDLANGLKANITRARTATLGLSLAGAVLQTLAAFLPAGWVAKGVALAGALALVAVPFIASRALDAESVRRWLRARSVSEGLKSAVFRYLGRGLPFDGADADARFEAMCRETEKWVDELAVELAEVPVTESEPPPVRDDKDYVKLRVQEQIANYYRPQAQRNAIRARFFRRAESVVALLAALLGAAATALQLSESGSKTIGAWVAVLTTIGATLAAHAAASRFDIQARVFFATARELEDLVHGWERGGHAPGVASWAEFVARCEDAISAENRGWMAKLDPQEKPAAK